MRAAIPTALVAGAAMVASLALVGCPVRPTYPSTITPVYAATTNGLFVYDGTNWTNYTTSSGLASDTLSSVVVLGSGSGAQVFVGTNLGISASNYIGPGWATWNVANGGLVNNTVNSLFVGSSVCAATNGGVSRLNGQAWTNDAAVTPVDDVFTFADFTFLAAGTVGAAKLYIYNGTVQAAGSPVATSMMGLASGSVTSVFVDSFGDLIVGASTGLAVQYAGNSGWTSLLPGASVKRVTADSSGNIYAATGSGLYTIVGTNATLVRPGAALCVCVDGAGTIYVGTATGLQVSKDGGSTWAPVAQLSGRLVNSVTTTAPLYSF